MAIVQPDIVEGSGARLTRDGMVVTRAFRVRELSAGTASGRMVAAIAAVTAQGTAYGSVHPDYPGIYADEFIPSPVLNSKDAVRVLVNYHARQAADNEGSTTFDGSVQHVTTSYDATRTLILVNYTNADNVASAPQIAKLSGGKAVGTLTIDATVTSDPKAKLVYLNKVNSATWLDQPAYCWWISNIWYQRALGRPGWRLRITAQYDEQTWVKTAVWRDIHGEIPSNVNAGAALDSGLGAFNGYTNALISGTADLAGLITGINVDF